MRTAEGMARTSEAMTFVVPSQRDTSPSTRMTRLLSSLRRRANTLGHTIT